jgi:hypothetical protein
MKSTKIFGVGLILGLFLCSPAIAQEDLNSMLAAYWSFNESEGDMATDGSANGNYLTLVEDTWWSPGKYGNGIYLPQDETIFSYAMAEDDLLSDNFPSVSIGDTAIEALTIAAWINVDIGGLTDRNSLVTKEQIGNRGFTFEIKNGYLAAQIYKNENDANKPESNTTLLEEGEWYHVAMTYEFIDDGISEIILYVNGEEDFVDDSVVGPLKNNAAPLRVGAYIYDPAGYQKYFYGIIDEVYVYRRVLLENEIKQLMESSGPTEVQSFISDNQPHSFELFDNYPNPFNPSTTIGFSLSEKSNVTVKVFDLKGREIAVLLENEMDPGTYRIQFDASAYSSGIYFYRLQAGDKSRIKRMVVIK